MLTHSGLLNRVHNKAERLSFTRITPCCILRFFVFDCKNRGKDSISVETANLIPAPKTKKLHSRRLLCSLLREKDGTNDYKPSKTTKTWQRTEKSVTDTETVR
jgi:hypothetical protein